MGGLVFGGIVLILLFALTLLALTCGETPAERAERHTREWIEAQRRLQRDYPEYKITIKE